MKNPAIKIYRDRDNFITYSAYGNVTQNEINEGVDPIATVCISFCDNLKTQIEEYARLTQKLAEWERDPSIFQIIQDID